MNLLKANGDLTMTKSSLKTFLAGKNPMIFKPLKETMYYLREAMPLHDACLDIGKFGESSFYDTSTMGIFCIDVLDDGTAITYCMNTDNEL